MLKMENSTENNDINDFLRRVNELEAVVKGDLTVSSEESLDQVQASGNGGDQLYGQKPQNTKPVNRTVINKDAYKSDLPPAALDPGGNQPQSMSQDGFLKAVEKDAAERAQQRKERSKVATEWKDKGNVEFKAGHYEKAIEHYTEGLSHLKDFGALYTNRAQAYNKLGKFQEAIEDCDLILRLEPKNTKAHIHRGKALLGLGQHDEAIDSYREVLKYDQKQEMMVNQYISAAKRARVAAEAEANASKTVKEGNTEASHMMEILQKLHQPGLHVMFYAGGMRYLARMLKDDTARTLFRTGKGFEMLRMTSIQRCFSKVVEGEVVSESVEVVQSFLELVTEATLKNDENCKVLLEMGNFPTTFLGLLGSRHPTVSQMCVALLLRLTENPVGRMGVISKFDNASLLVGLLAIVQTSKSGSSEAAKVLNNLALEKKFTSQFRNKVDSEVLPAFEKFLTNYGSSRKGDVFPSCISFMGNMALDPVIRKQIANRKEFWVAAVSVLKSHSKHLPKQASREVVYTMLGLLTNISLETTEALKDQSEGICKQTLPLLRTGDSDVQERATSLLARVVPHSLQAVEEACQAGVPEKMLQALQIGEQDVESKGAFIRCLAALTQNSQEARQQLVGADPGLRCLVSLLDTDSAIMIANTALTISHCVEIPGVSDGLLDTDIVKTLLAKTDTTNETIKQNCAIALAKLATSDQRHLEQLKELGGMGILHSCSKYALK